MRSFWQIFWLELKAFRRSHALALLGFAAAVWMFAAPYVLVGDGTAKGARELVVRYSLGGVFILTVIALVASATGSLARERTAKRLQLTLVRPVSRWVIAAAKSAALTSVGATILAFAVLVTFIREGNPDRQCNRVLYPILPSAREEAKAMYANYISSPDTPEVFKRTKKDIALRMLENRVIDRYETIPTNGVVRWKFDFPLSEQAGLPSAIAVRLHFSGAYNRRELAFGKLSIAGYAGTISNLTQSVVSVPLVISKANRPSPVKELVFANRGATALQFRPRRDVQLLIPSDGFGWNLLRTYFELVSILALLIAFGLFLSASLGRPVAVFVAFAVLALGEMSPSVIASYPDDLEENAADRIGLVLTRAAAEVTSPVASLNPLEKLAMDDRVEPQEVLRVILLDLLAVPAILFILAAVVLSRKHDGD